MGELSRDASPEQVVADSVYLGRGLYGAAAASRAMFGVEPQDLTWAQAALMAGLVQSPSSTDPRCHADRALKRRHWVLLQLLEQAVISKSEFDATDTSPLALAAPALAWACPPRPLVQRSDETGSIDDE